MTSIYSIAGLKVSSDIPLPALIAQGGERSDISIVCETDRAIPVFDADFSGANWAMGHGVWSLHDGAGLHLLQRDSILHVWSDGDPAAPSKLQWIIGAGMAASLLRYGHVPWHASAVGIGGKAFLTMGESGSGKSSVAMALIDQGGEILADDMVCPKLLPGRAEMQPVFLNLRLATDTARHFGVFGVPFTDKRSVDVARAKDDSARKIAAVFVLAKRGPGEGMIERLPNAIAFAELLRNLFARTAVPFFSRMDDAIAIAKELVTIVPVFRLVLPEGIEEMTAFMGRLTSEVLRGS